MTPAAFLILAVTFGVVLGVEGTSEQNTEAAYCVGACVNIKQEVTREIEVRAE